LLTTLSFVIPSEAEGSAVLFTGNQGFGPSRNRSSMGRTRL